MASRSTENDSNTTVEIENTKPPPRSYEQLKADLKSGKAVVMTGEEGKIFARGNREAKAAKAKKSAEAQKKFEGAINCLFGNIVFKSLFYLVYTLWNLLPLAGIVIGFIYLSAENCPPRPSIAPLIITLGFMSLFVSISFGSKQAQKKQNTEETVTKENPEAVPLETIPENAESPPTAPPQEKSSEGIGGAGAAACLACGLCALCGGCCLICFIFVLKIAHLILFIVTSCIVYGFYPDAKTDKTGLSDAEVEESYCNNVLLYFAFWSLTVCYIILGVLFFLFCCGCSSFVATQNKSSDAVENQA